MHILCDIHVLCNECPTFCNLRMRFLVDIDVVCRNSVCTSRLEVQAMQLLTSICTYLCILSQHSIAQSVHCSSSSPYLCLSVLQAAIADLCCTNPLCLCHNYAVCARSNNWMHWRREVPLSRRAHLLCINVLVTRNNTCTCMYTCVHSVLNSRR